MKDTLSHMEPFEDEGVFWLPSSESDQRTGRLKFDPAKGATLIVMGGFGDIRDQFNERPPIIRIHGVAGKRYLTLDGCFVTNTQLDMPGIPRQTYHVGSIITGRLFGENEALSFDRCAITFDQLPNWVRRSGVTVSFETATPQLTQPPDRLIVEFKQLEDDVVQLEEDELRLVSTWGLAGDNITETNLSQGAHLELRYSKGRSLESILGDVKHLQDLLTLVIAAPVVPTGISLWREDITRELPTGETRPQEMTYFAGQLAEQVRLDEPQSPMRILFQFPDIGGLSTMARWIKVAREYQTVVGSLLSIRYAAGLYVENRFNNVISAAESFHRMRFSNEVMPEEEFKEFRRSLIRAVPKEHRNWLGNQLQYSNEPRLRNRLTEMVGHAGEAFAAVSHDSSAWVTVITESRNRLTHHDKERVIDFQPGDLYFLTESLFTLVMLCLLRECGMSDQTLGAIATNSTIIFLRGKLGEIIPRLHAQVTRS